uniref:C2H2-type domain-containing protein n=1 Tax=Anopheles atroparvus TaxID=41427 RepID=A0AAG5D190_ANOAO
MRIKMPAVRIAQEPENASTHCASRGASPLGCSLDDEHDQKPSVRAIEIKQERMDIDPRPEDLDFVGRKQQTTQSPRRNGTLEDDMALRKSRTLNTALAPDATEPHTINSEPSNYVCSTCKTKYHSAWRLVQHVQHAHGVKIYVESLASTGNQDGGAAPTEVSDAPESAAASDEVPRPASETVSTEKSSATTLLPAAADSALPAIASSPRPLSRCASRNRRDVSVEEADDTKEQALELKEARESHRQEAMSVDSVRTVNGVDGKEHGVHNGEGDMSDEEIEVRAKRTKLANVSSSSSNGSGGTPEEMATLALTSPQALATSSQSSSSTSSSSSSSVQRQSTTPQPPATRSPFLVQLQSPPANVAASSSSSSVTATTPTTTTPARSESSQSLPPPGLRAHHSLLPPPELHQNPFGLLRMPHHPHSPLFGRAAHHDFRMEHLMTEQFRNHGLNLAAAAVAAANQLKTHSQQFTPATGATASERPPSAGAAAAAALTLTPGVAAPGGALVGLEPHMDYYSQRLRQLAGTTSPGANITSISSNSPSPRKQQHSPSHFASPSPSQLPPTPLTNNSRPQSLTPPEKNTELGLGLDAGSIMANTPRSASTPPNKQSHHHHHQASDGALYSCDFCGKKFRFQSNLLVHRRTHTSELPFKCTSCEFSCAQASKLKQHMKMVHSRTRPSVAISEPDTASNVDSIESDSDDPDHDLMDAEDLDADGRDGEDRHMAHDGDGEDDDDDDDDDEDEDDEAEDLSMSSTQSQSKKEGGSGGSLQMSTSLVGELMDKFGLSNIAQYSEAYKQALQESGNALKLQLTSKDRDNNNSAMAIPGLAEKLNGLPSALRIKEELAKNMLQHHNPQLPQVPLFNPFENPFEASKRMKLEGGDSWWGIPGLHRNESLFENLKPGRDGGVRSGGGLMQPMMKKESKLRNDTCEFCGKVFKNCSNLTVHRRSHTGEKPYKCELCSYACAQSSKLTRHMKTHGRLGKDVYRCRFCEMPFSVPSTLEKHMRKCVVNQGKLQQQQQRELQQLQQQQQQLHHQQLAAQQMAAAAAAAQHRDREHHRERERDRDRDHHHHHHHQQQQQQQSAAILAAAAAASPSHVGAPQIPPGLLLPPLPAAVAAAAAAAAAGVSPTDDSLASGSPSGSSSSAASAAAAAAALIKEEAASA